MNLCMMCNNKVLCSYAAKLAAAQTHSMTENSIKARAKSSRDWKNRNRKKVQAQNKAFRQIKPGQCKVQGCESKGHRHHSDYRKPLEVSFMCQKHHMELRRKKKKKRQVSSTQE